MMMVMMRMMRMDDDKDYDNADDESHVSDDDVENLYGQRPTPLLFLVMR